MPKYQISEKATGRTIQFDWHDDTTPPSEADIDGIFAEAAKMPVTPNPQVIPNIKPSIPKPQPLTPDMQNYQKAITGLQPTIAKQPPVLTNRGNLTLPAPAPPRIPEPQETRWQGQYRQDMSSGNTPQIAAHEAIEKDPWVDPVTTGLVGTGMATTIAKRAGAGLLPAFVKAIPYGAGTAAIDYPVGQATEFVGKDHPNLALPFNMLMGVISPPSMNKVVGRAAGKASGAVPRVIPDEPPIPSKFDATPQSQPPSPPTAQGEIHKLLRMNEPKSAEPSLETSQKYKPKEVTQKPPYQETYGTANNNAVAIDRTIPQIVGSTESSGIIRLQFDNAYRVPTPEEIKSFAKSKGYDVDVTKFKQDIISGTQGATDYRLDVFSPEGFITGKGSQELSKEFGGRFRTKTTAEQSLPLSERMGRVHTKMGENLGIKKAEPPPIKTALSFPKGIEHPKIQPTEKIEPEINAALKGKIPKDKPTGKVEKIKIVKDVMKFTPSQRQTLEQAIKDISSGELVKKQGLKDTEGYYTGETLSGASMYPKYFQNKGYTSKEVLNAIKKSLNGQPITKNQQIIVEDINQGIREQWAGALKEQRATKDVTAWDLHEGDKLKRHGETYTVKSVDDTEFEPKVTIKNSETLTLKGDESIKYDRGTLKKGEAPKEPDFVKTEIKGEEQGIWRGKGFDAEFPTGYIAPKEMKGKPKAEGQEDIFEPTLKETEKQEGLFGNEKGSLIFGRPEPFKDDKVWNSIKRSREMSAEKRKTSASKIYKALKSNLVDVSGNIKDTLNSMGDLGKLAVRKHDVIAGSSSKAIQEFNTASKKIYKGLSSTEHDYLDSYVFSKRNIEIARNKPEFTFQDGLTVKDFQDNIVGIPKKLLPDIEKRAKAYWGEMSNLLDQLHKEGLITAEVHDKLKANGMNYSPRRVLHYIDPELYPAGSKKITVPSSGLHKLSDTGTDKLIETDTSLLLSEAIKATHARIFRNRANKALYDIATKAPDNGIISLHKPTIKAPHGFEKLSVMIDGKPKTMIMPKELAKEWITRDPILSQQQANTISWFSGTKILKPMATGLNPEFAIPNMFRDLAHIFLTTDEYSSIAPKAALEMGNDLRTVFTDAFGRKGSYIDYINEGGGMEFLTHQGRFSSKTSGIIGNFQKVMGYLGESSEILTRLALRNRAMRNGKSGEEATYIARNYLDFNQGGSIAKAFDSGIPYLNAGIQGTRGIIRAAADNPKLFTFKASQIGTIAAGLYFANRYQNPEAMKQISDRDKVNNWIITTPLSYKDKEGTKKWIYAKIPKDQGQRVLSSIFEGMAALMAGDKVDGNQITQGVKEFLPLLPDQAMSPTLKALVGYSTNTDFWKGERIWSSRTKIKAEEEYTRYTSPAMIEAGKVTGASPERLQYALSQYFTNGNIWTSMTGYAYNNLLSGIPKEEREKVTQELVMSQPFIRRFAAGTDPKHEYQEMMEDADIEANTKRFKTNRDFDSISKLVFEGKQSKSAVKEQLRQAEPDDRYRLLKRYVAGAKLQNVPDKRFWIDLGDLAPEARAKVFMNRYNQIEKAERKQFLNTAQQIPGIVSKDFVKELIKLKQGGVQ